MRIASFAALLLASFPSAQDPVPRIRVPGVARSSDGVPWADAQIELRAFLPKEDVIPLEVDRVVVQSDARGRFVAELLPLREYLAWAESGDAGERLVSEVVRVRAGELLEIRMPTGATAPTQLKLGPFEGEPGSLVCFERAIGRETRYELHGDELTLPPSSCTEATIEVLDETGRVLAVGEVPLDGGQHAIGSGASRPRRVRVMKSSDLGPCAEVAIGFAHLGRILPLMETDADGKAIVELARITLTLDGRDRPGFDDGCWLVVEEPGYELGLLYFDAVGPVGPLESRGFDAECGLIAAATPSGIRIVFDGVPLEGLALQMPTQVMERRGEVGTGTMSFPFAQRTGSDGVLEWQGNFGWSWWNVGDLLPGPRQLPAFSARWQPFVLQRIPLPLERAFAGRGAPRDFDVFAEFRPLEIQVVSATGGPLVDAEVYVGPVGQLAAFGWRTDRAGRARVLVPMRTEAPVYGFVCDVRGWAAFQIQRFRLPAPSAEPTHLRLNLQPSVVVDAHVVRADGSTPVQRARIYATALEQDGRRGRMEVDLRPGESLDDRRIFTTCDGSMVTLLRRETGGLRELSDGHTGIAIPAVAARWRVMVWSEKQDVSSAAEIGAEAGAGRYPVEFVFGR